MATPIVVKPVKPSAIIIGGKGKSGTPIHIDDSIDWGRVEGIATDAARDALNEMAVDDHLSVVSTNAVQNKVITAELESVVKKVKKNSKLAKAAL